MFIVYTNVKLDVFDLHTVVDVHLYCLSVHFITLATVTA